MRIGVVQWDLAQRQSDPQQANLPNGGNGSTSDRNNSRVVRREISETGPLPKISDAQGASAVGGTAAVPRGRHVSRQSEPAAHYAGCAVLHMSGAPSLALVDQMPPWLLLAFIFLSAAPGVAEWFWQSSIGDIVARGRPLGGFVEQPAEPANPCLRAKLMSVVRSDDASYALLWLTRTPGGGCAAAAGRETLIGWS